MNNIKANRNPSVISLRGLIRLHTRPESIDAEVSSHLIATPTRLFHILTLGISTACAHIFAGSKFSPRTLLQHPQMHSCCSCYAFGRQAAAVRGGNSWKSSQKKENRPRQTYGFFQHPPYGMPRLVVGRPLSLTHSIHAGKAWSCICQGSYAGFTIFTYVCISWYGRQLITIFSH